VFRHEMQDTSAKLPVASTGATTCGGVSLTGQ
jgi:hypothetical protein